MSNRRSPEHGREAAARKGEPFHSMYRNSGSFRVSGNLHLWRRRNIVAGSVARKRRCEVVVVHRAGSKGGSPDNEQHSEREAIDRELAAACSGTLVAHSFGCWRCLPFVALLPGHAQGPRSVQADAKANLVPFAVADEHAPQVLRQRIIVAAWRNSAGVVFCQPFPNIRKGLLVGSQGQAGRPCVVIHGAYAFVGYGREVSRAGGRARKRTHTRCGISLDGSASSGLGEGDETAYAVARFCVVTKPRRPRLDAGPFLGQGFRRME